VIARDIPFRTVCEHHLLPFSGVAQVGATTVTATLLGSLREDARSRAEFRAGRRSGVIAGFGVAPRVAR
jgi:GTP cyclohydrolase I